MYLEACKDYREILLECFSADEELVNVHHIQAGSGIEWHGDAVENREAIASVSETKKSLEWK